MLTETAKNYKVFKTQLIDLKETDIKCLNDLKYERNDMWNSLVEWANPLYKDKEYPSMTEIYQYLRKKFPSSLMKQIDGVSKAYRDSWNLVYKIKDHKEPKFHSWIKCKGFTHSTNHNSIIPSKDGERSHYKLTKNVKLTLAESPGKILRREDIATISITEKAGKYFISVTWKESAPEPKTVSTKGAIGLDFGFIDFFTDSEGRIHNLPESYFKKLKRIKILQRALAKKPKINDPNGIINTNTGKILKRPTENRLAVNKKLSRAWLDLANIKKDWIEKLTTYLLKNYDVIVLEDLNLKGIKNFKGNRRKSVHNTFGTFRSRLLEKSANYTAKVILADRFFPSSQLCSNCGKLHPEMKNLNNREIICECGYKESRDVNATINLKNFGENETRKTDLAPTTCS